MLTRRVESAIAADPLLSVNARNVDVSVDNGIVTLQGSVADKNFRRDVERAISEVPGVLATRNQIDVSMTRDTNDRESDDRIAFALQRSLTSLPSLRDGAELVSIEVVHGHVVLRGSTDSVEARERIKDLVAGTPGVNAITNEVTIRP
ncbi:MAG TPA: BON domain-containing protein [Labilithrix sp.]|nr:BON domain-containing protein [Labilithrix sp.]